MKINKNKTENENKMVINNIRNHNRRNADKEEGGGRCKLRIGCVNRYRDVRGYNSRKWGRGGTNRKASGLN